MNFKGLTAIVTGSTSGIGKEIALSFAKNGANVVVVGRNEQRGQEVVNQIQSNNGRAIFVPTDLTIESSVRSMVSTAAKSFMSIDILVNNAGILIPGSIPDITLDSWEKTWKTNVSSVYLTSHYTIPYMVRQKSGIIINVSSEIGLKGFKNRAAYSAAKAAVIALTKSMAVDHAESGIRVNCICPGTVETEVFNNLISYNIDPEKQKKIMLDRRLTPYLGSVEEIARAVLFLADPEMKYMTGTILSVDGGASAK